MSDRLRHVVHVAPLLAPLAAAAPGGAEWLVQALARRQAAARMRVTVLAAAPNAAADPGVAYVEVAQAGRLLPVPTGGGDPGDFEERARREAEVFAGVADWLARYGATVDLIHNHAFDAWPFRHLHTFGPPVVHTLGLGPEYPWVTAAVRRLVGRRSVCLVAVSRSLAAAWRRQGVPTTVVYNGVELSEVPVGMAGGGPWFWAGRISPEKGLDEAIAAVDERGEGPLWVAGRIYDAAYAAALPLADPERVHYLGPVPHGRLMRLLARARGLLAPVRWEEPFGLVYAEAQCAGCPVVAYRRGALPELVVDGVTGFLVAPNDRDAFARALDRVKVLDRRQLASRSRRRWSLRRTVSRYRELYRQLWAIAPIAG